jgi:hypothetical protein
MFTKLAKPLRRLFSGTTSYFFTLFAAVVAGISLFGGTAAIANHERIDPRVCQEQFQRETEKCRTLTGFARAACQQQAAARFRTCRAQPASPSAPGPQALASVMGPGAAAINNPQTNNAVGNDIQGNKGRVRPTRAIKGSSRSRAR